MTAAARVRDFPDWLGPMLIKELRQGLKTRAFVLSFILLQVVFVLVLVYHALLYRKEGEGFNASGLNVAFWMVVGFQLLFVTPLRALNDLAGERKANTLELIFVTGLTPWRIVLGKWTSLIFQSFLFVLAVLPYGILRYFFGGVNLVEELGELSQMLLLCGVFTAAALAISGLPIVVRVGAVIIAIIAGSGGAEALLVEAFLGGGRAGGSGFDWPWYVTMFDASVLIVCALLLGASTIAPPAENYALRQRLPLALLLIPVPLLHWLHVANGAVVIQLCLAAGLLFFTSLHNLAAAPTLLHRHFEPFAKFGVAGFIAAAFFLPGPASAALFLALGETALVIAGRLAFDNPRDAWDFASVLLMIGGALITVPALWKLIRRKTRWMLTEQIAFQILCGCIPIFMLNLKRDDFHFVASPFTAAFPPVGLWLMTDRNGNADWGSDWFSVAAVAFVVWTLFLEALFQSYWRAAWATFADRCRNRKAASMPARTPLASL